MDRNGRKGEKGFMSMDGRGRKRLVLPFLAVDFRTEGENRRAIIREYVLGLSKQTLFLFLTPGIIMQRCVFV